jgi:hypothetical protein
MSKKILTAADLRFNPPTFSKATLHDEIIKTFGLSGILKLLVGERDQNHLLTTDASQGLILSPALRNSKHGNVERIIVPLRPVCFCTSSEAANTKFGEYNSKNSLSCYGAISALKIKGTTPVSSAAR